MIKIIDGDLLNSGADIICHQVNCQGAMNSGVAKQIRHKWPEVYSAYIAMCEYRRQRPESLLGYAQSVNIYSTKQFIINLFAQCNYGYDGQQYTDVKALKECFEQVRTIMSSVGRVGGISPRLAIPYKIGCVRGGANWDEVYAIIEEVFHDCDVELWRLDKG